MMLVLLSLIALGSPIVDAEEDLALALAEPQARYVEGLEQLADWCQAEQAFAARNQALSAILHFEPDHARARRLLRYRYDRKSETWVRRGTFREPKAGPSDAREAYATRRAAFDTELCRASIEVLDEYAGELPGRTLFGELRGLMVVAPSDAALRERLGYALQKSTTGERHWVTALSLDTPERRAKLGAWLEEARSEAADVQDAALDETDRAVDLSWQYVLRSGATRIVARAGKEETLEALEAAETARLFLARILGRPVNPRPEQTLYLMKGVSDMKRFVASYPGLDESRQERARKLGSMWLPGKTRCGVWGSDRATRTDMSSKQMAVRFVETQFGIEPKRGWLVDALGLYVNQHVVGTRISRHVTITDYAKPGEVPLTQGLEDSDADWLAIAHRVLGVFTTEEFARALGRNTNELTAEDMVVGYALVAYLCEASDPKAMAHVLKEVGSETASSVAALEAWFQLPLPEIKIRLRDWLGDVVLVPAQDVGAVTGR
ncbi:MAG: hypothetical protein AAGG01_13820 [Planctomycetota bacterium]